MVNLVSFHIYVKSQFLDDKYYSWKERIYFCNTSVKTANEAKEAHPVQSSNIIYLYL